MFSIATSTTASALEELARALENVRAAAKHCSDGEAFGIVTAALRHADALNAIAAETIGARGGLESTTGLSSEIALMLEGRRTGSEARMLTQTATTLRAMPETARAFANGEVSYGQVRAIVLAVRHVDPAGRAAVDGLVARRAREMTNADPDELVKRVDDLVARLRSD